MVAAVDVASHAVDGVVQGFVLTWPIKAAFLAAAGARANAGASLVAGLERAGSGRDAGGGCAAHGRAGGPLFLVFVLWVLSASVVLLRDASRPVAARTRPMEPAAAGRWQALSSALLGRPI